MTLTGFWSPLQTWWGFPTWRETLSVNWNDPTRQVNDNVRLLVASFGQPNGLTPRPTSTVPVRIARAVASLDVDAGYDGQGGTAADRLRLLDHPAERRSSSATR